MPFQMHLVAANPMGQSSGGKRFLLVELQGRKK
jgi:hypothetical protein